MKSSWRRMARILGAALCLSVLIASQAQGKWAAVTQMPTARLLKNVGEYVKAHPKDANGYYTLGRINSAAFATESENIIASQQKEDELPQFPGYSSVIYPHNSHKTLSGQSLTYLADALRNYKRATELDPKKPLAFLGLGFQCEEALRFPEALNTAWKALALPQKPNTEALRQAALTAYRKAYDLAIEGDLMASHRLVTAPSQEAAAGILRLQEGRKLTAPELQELTNLKANLDKLNKQPRAVTPILISFRPSDGLSDLLAPGSQVRFDLDGSGEKRAWPWTKPTTGILVWDPKHTGKITSGLQLFGNVTWWLFWKDGYEPLAALDNDHNGWLEGKELEGLAVWFDRNGNGISDPGEVVSLGSLGIKRIAVHATGQCEGAPCNFQGVQLSNGSYAATFDWTPTALPIQEIMPASASRPLPPVSIFSLRASRFYGYVNRIIAVFCS